MASPQLEHEILKHVDQQWPSFGPLVSFANLSNMRICQFLWLNITFYLGLGGPHYIFLKSLI